MQKNSAPAFKRRYPFKITATDWTQAPPRLETVTVHNNRELEDAIKVKFAKASDFTVDAAE